MTSPERLFRQFRACELAADAFHHADHVRLAWFYLRRWPLPRAAARFIEDLRRFAAFHGKAERFHATATWAHLVLVQERMGCVPEHGRGPAERDWERFAANNEDLMRWEDGLFFRYYPRSIMESEMARRVFVLPRAVPWTAEGEGARG